MWLLHLPQWLTTSANQQPKAITFANKNGCQIQVTITSVTKKHQKVWHKSITNDKYVKFWQNKHPKLYTITFSIHHQKWVLWQGKHVPIHRMKPCQMDWQKLVVLEKMYSIEEKISYFIENQTE